MTKKLERSAWLGAALIAASAFLSGAHSAEYEVVKGSAALAAAVKAAPISLEQGMRTSETKGRPISAKFESEEGKLHLSVYNYDTASHGYSEVLIAPDSGALISAEKITDPGDLKNATAQKAAMEKASVSLIEATQSALSQNAGSRAVSVFPELKNGHPVAAVTLLRNGQFATVSEKLD